MGNEPKQLQKLTPSLYKYAKEQDVTNTKKMHWWAAPKLFFVYSEWRTINSPRQMAKEHTITLKSKTYAMGKLVDVIWGENWNVKYFVNNLTKMSFGKLIHDMYHPNPKAQIMVQQVVCTLIGLHTIGLHFTSVIKGNHKQFVVATCGIYGVIYMIFQK